MFIRTLVKPWNKWPEEFQRNHYYHLCILVLHHHLIDNSICSCNCGTTVYKMQFVKLNTIILQIWMSWHSESNFMKASINLPRLYQTSISPLNVLTSMIVWPRKSSDSLVNFCMSLDLRSSSSSLGMGSDRWTRTH